MEQDNTEALSNVDVIWLKSIFDDLRNLQELLLLARTGFSNVDEMMGIPESSLVEIQLRNLSFVLISFSSVLDNVQMRIDKEFYKETKEFLQKIEKAFSVDKSKKRPDRFFKIITNQKLHTYTKTLLPYFFETIDVIDRLKSKLIRELDPILYYTQDTDRLDKSKKRK